MKTVPILLVASGLLLFSLRALALDPVQVATFDRYVISPDELFFEEDTSLTPDKTFIVLRNFRALSTPDGQRFALVTVQNQLNSRKSLDREEFVGVFADGTKAYPSEIDVKIGASSTFSFILNFGEHPFPLVKVVIDNGKS